MSPGKEDLIVLIDNVETLVESINGDVDEVTNYGRMSLEDGWQVVKSDAPAFDLLRYNAESKIMEIVWSDGSVWRYTPISNGLWMSFRDAPFKKGSMLPKPGDKKSAKREPVGFYDTNIAPRIKSGEIKAIRMPRSYRVMRKI